MNDKTGFQAFEDRLEQLAMAIVLTLLGSAILRFVFLLVDLP